MAGDAPPMVALYVHIFLPKTTYTAKRQTKRTKFDNDEDQLVSA